MPETSTGKPLVRRPSFAEAMGAEIAKAGVAIAENTAKAGKGIAEGTKKVTDGLDNFGKEISSRAAQIVAEEQLADAIAELEVGERPPTRAPRPQANGPARTRPTPPARRAPPTPIRPPPPPLASGDRIAVFWTEENEWYTGAFTSSRVERDETGSPVRISRIMYDAVPNKWKQQGAWHCLDDVQWKRLDVN